MVLNVALSGQAISFWEVCFKDVRSNREVLKIRLLGKVWLQLKEHVQIRTKRLNGCLEIVIKCVNAVT